jgi:methylthioribulose-1-phosphate dehydratase
VRRLDRGADLAYVNARTLLGGKKPMSINDKRLEAARQMVDAARAFYAHGWLFGTSGNLSVRLDAQTFLITASGKDKGQLGPEDFLVCDLAGQPTEATDHRPSAETLVHCVIYRRYPKVGAIYHVHQLHAALCSARDQEAGHTVFADLEMIKGLNIWEPDARIEVPIIANHFDIPTLASAIGRRLESAQFDRRVPGVNIYNHGIYAWGNTAFEARRHVETFGYLYHYSWEAL